MTRKRLGEVLMDQGLIDDEDLQQALSYQEKSGYRLGTSLVALRIIAEWQLTEALGAALDVEVIDLSEVQPEAEALERLSATLAERYDLIPVRMEEEVDRGKVLVVAMSDPLNRSNIQRIEHAAGCPVHPALASLSAIQRSIRIHYHGASPGKVLSAASRIKAPAAETMVGSNPMERATLDSLLREASALAKGESLPASGVGLDRDLAMRLRFEALLLALEDRDLLSRADCPQHLKLLIDKRAVSK